MTLQRADKWGFDARVLTINFKNIQNCIKSIEESI